ncbi:sensor histidine kinase [Maridesulfovibrio sp.]|uniref:sensor histidine kinase n=1 Tax=Maridesulfovibrio sp. TaxID=2795000 RepID=UPI0039EEF97D
MERTRKYHGIRRVLLLSMIIVPFIPLIVAATIGYYSHVRSTEKLALSAIRLAAVDHGDMITFFLNERRSDLMESMELLGVEIGNTTKARAMLTELRSLRSDMYSDLGLIDPDGNQVAYVGDYPLENKNYLESDWYRKTISKGYNISDIYLGLRGVPHLNVSVSKLIANKEWVLRATLRPGALRRLAEKVNIGDTGEAYIINSASRLQTSRRSGGEMFDRDRYPYPAQKNGVITFSGVINSEKYIFASTSLNDGKWRLIVRQKRADAFQASNSALFLILAILVCGGSVLVLLAVFASNKVYDMLTRQADTVCALEGQFIRAAKLAELGEMSAGFAHEINNPLQIMKSDLALLDILLEEQAESFGEGENKDEILEINRQLKLQIDRCAGITREILNFGRQNEPELKEISIVDYLPQVATMVEKKAKLEGIRLTFDVDRLTPPVLADQGLLQQVMVNLLNNAIHAVVEQHGPEGGEIVVAAGPDLNGDTLIKVGDNGIGIHEKDMDRIFLPFYSTKKDRNGTGLGLAVCHSVIDSLGGRLRVRSERHKGTEFSITLPALRKG